VYCCVLRHVLCKTVCVRCLVSFINIQFHIMVGSKSRQYLPLRLLMVVLRGDLIVVASKLMSGFHVQTEVVTIHIV
jgi:hypothetical protein